MNAAQAHFSDFARPIAREQVQPTPEVLTALRLAALKCRTSARTDLFEACALLSTDRQSARAAHVEVLTKCLAQALGKAPVFHRPGAGELSFDEAWLMRLVDSSAAGDMDSFGFLLRSRVARSAQRNLAFLVHRISECFAPV